MKTILIMRHAKSSWKSPARDDFDRPLNQRGKRDARRMADFVIREGLCPDVILSSPARRARKTADRIQRTCGEALLKFVDGFYPGSTDDYAAVLSRLDESIVSVMIVGHNPSLEDFLAFLGGSVEKFPTAALAQIELPLENWSEIGATTSGTLRGFWKPRDLLG